MRMLVVAVLLAGGVGNAAHAQSALTYYDCDTPGGHFSMVRLDLGPEQKSISGVIRPLRLYGIKDWNPAAGIALNDGTREARISLGSAKPGKEMVDAGLPVAFAVTGGDMKVRKERQILLQADLGASVPFTLTANGSKVEFQIGERRGAVDVALVGKLEVALSCSTGNFHFEQLKQF